MYMLVIPALHIYNAMELIFRESAEMIHVIVGMDIYKYMTAAILVFIYFIEIYALSAISAKYRQPLYDQVFK